METLNKADYIQWRDSKETKTLFSEIKEAVEGAVATLVEVESYDAERIQFLKGVIKGFSQVLTWRPELVEDAQNES